jgi:hypothetical protein
MSRKNFSEFLEFSLKGLNPFEIQPSFKLELFLEICNSKSRGIWKLGQKRNLFHLNFLPPCKVWDFWGLRKMAFSIFKVESFEVKWKV